MEINKIEAAIEKIKCEECLCEEETFSSIECYLQDVVEVYMALIEELSFFREAGIDLPEDVILQQVKNLEEAMLHKDVIKLYDTFKYEVLNTFEVYRDICLEMRG